MAELQMKLGFDSVEKGEGTTSLTKTYKCLLTINDFQKVSRGQGLFYLSQFISFEDCEHKWTIRMYNTSDYYSVSANLVKEMLGDKKLMVEFSILDGNDKKHYIKLAAVTNGESMVVNFVSKTELRNLKSKFLLNNQLRLLCRIFDLSSDESPNRGPNITVNHSQNHLLEGFDRLLSNEKFSDFKFKVKGKEFNVHRAILAARSPVFEAMFESDMCEASEKKVDIDDVEPEVAEKMLRFIYTGEIDFGNLAPEQILIVAEKYQLESLKLRCENELAKGLNVVNVYDILLLADQNNAAHLTKKAIQFFDRNVKKLVASEDFKTCVNSLPPDLRTEIIYISALNR